MMNQPPELPLLGLSLAIPRHYAEQAILEVVRKGIELLPDQIETEQTLDELKKKHWQWVLETCSVLKDCFGHGSTGLYFSSSVYIQPSVKLNDFEREREEFPPTVKGRLERLQGLIRTLPVIPEPPAGDFVSALLHPKIANKAWRPFELGKHNAAIAAAIAELETAIKEATANSITATGHELFMRAFDPDSGPLADMSAGPADRQGLCQMLTGFVLRYGNLSTYLDVSIQEASRALAIASHLMFLVEDRISALAHEVEQANANTEHHLAGQPPQSI